MMSDRMANSFYKSSDPVNKRMLHLYRLQNKSLSRNYTHTDEVTKKVQETSQPEQVAI